MDIFKGMLFYVLNIALNLLGCALLAVFAIFAVQFIQCIKSFKKSHYKRFVTYFKAYCFKPQFINFLKYVVFDIIDAMGKDKIFMEFGLTLYCGRQGSGKSISIVEYLERMRVLYPHCVIVTNFGYKYQTYAFNDWHDLLEYRNGTDGVIFVIDEIQNEYSSDSWKDFPEFLLSEITQQRKQRIKIVGSSQVYTRVVKQLREQTFDVVECSTIRGRWTFQKIYDALDYNAVIDNPEKKLKLLPARRSFVQTDEIRELFDSYQKIERMRGKKYIARGDFANQK